MALVKWRGKGDVQEPFQALDDLQDEFTRLFRPVTGGRLAAHGMVQEWWPAVDVTEEQNRLLVRADLPGLKQEDMSVEVGEGILTISGERKQESDAKEGTVYRRERIRGAFQRNFALPAGVDAAKVNATYKEGILEIVLPKRDEAKAKKVKVEVR